jgi:hypothetical protein
MITAVRSLRKEYHKFKASLSYIVKPVSKTGQNKANKFMIKLLEKFKTKLQNYD